MPKLSKPTKADISAVFSDNVATKKYRNQNVISKIKFPRKSKSVKAQNAKDRFKSAISWAKSTLMDPDMKTLYSKGITDKLSNAQTVAVTDYMEAPKIHYVSLKDHHGIIGDKIRIKATDNFQVISVTVKITNAKGTLLEQGRATRYPRKPAMWVYILTVANPDLNGTVINVTAKDRPGNETELEEKVARELP